MKSSSEFSLSKPRGVALVVVLGILVLVIALLIGFLTLTVSERKSSASFKASMNTRQLADLATNLVQAQINDATLQGPGFAWASQPGAVRLFNNAGQEVKTYRLYSAGALTTPNASEMANDLPPGSWDADKASWTDLNAPVTNVNDDGAETKTFPILDPRDPENPSATVNRSDFSLNGAPGATAEQPAPMPVRWLYVLEKGDIVAPSGGSGTAVTVPGATAQNPIVGRIAFWTDDETCKININTASEGLFWDTPRFCGDNDFDLGTYQPAFREFQRYPGHPAMTKLQKALPFLTREQIIDLTPRYNYGGSKEGKTSVTGAIPLKDLDGDGKPDRLYTSVGELLFDPARQRSGLNREQLESSKFLLTAKSRAPEITLYGTPRVSMWPLSDNNNDQFRSPNDRLLAFASTVGGQPYYFTRRNKDSSTEDVQLSRNASLLGYLDTLTGESIPGFGGNFHSKYGAQGTRQILTEIFDYVRTTNLRDPSLAVANRYSGGTSMWSDIAGEGQVIPTNHIAWGTQGFGRFFRIVQASIIFVGVGQGAQTTQLTFPTTEVKLETNQAWNYSGAKDPLPPDNRMVQAIFVLDFFDPSFGWSAVNSNFTVEIKGLEKFKINGQNLGMTPSGSGVETIALRPGSSTIFKYGVYNASGGPLGSYMDYRTMLGGRKLGTDKDVNFPFYSQIIPVKSNVQTMGFQGDEVVINVFPNGEKDGDPLQTYTINFFPSEKQIPIPGVSGYRQFGALVGRAGVRGSATSKTSPDRFDRFYGSPEDGDKASHDNHEIFFMIDNGAVYSTGKDPKRPGDVVLSMIPAKEYGDYRMMAKKVVGSSTEDAFVPHPLTDSLSQNMTFGDGFATGAGAYGHSKAIDPLNFQRRGNLVDGAQYLSRDIGGSQPIVPASVKPTDFAFQPADWDNGIGGMPDGAYINKPDEGMVVKPGSGFETKDAYYYIQAMGAVHDASVLQGFFSPNRQVPSPVMFGSLPTGVLATPPKPWQTLLFRPGPTGHPGAAGQPAQGDPADNLLLDLFWMPVADPYAISEPFSTAGKVNMNYQIVPFTYIKRSTALEAVLDSEKVAEVGLARSTTYKVYDRTKAQPSLPDSKRQDLNLSDQDGTLRQFKEKFTNWGVFRSASEICDIFLVPKDRSWSSDGAARAAWYGNDFALVGDNTRERPYANIYPRLTTKSNTYKVHVRAQALKNPSANAAVWDEKSGVVVGDYRGATTIERYLDPNAAIPDYATNPNATPLDNFYRWRTVENYQFTP